MLSGARIERLAREFDRELRRLEATAITRLDAALYRAAQRLEAELRRYYMRTLEEAALSPNLLLREARARLLLEQVRAALNITAGSQANAAFTELIGDAFDLGERNALTTLALFQQEQVLATAGARLNVAARATQAAARLEHHGRAFALKAEELVIDGVVRGRGWGRTATELRRETGVTRLQAEMIVRTESVSASHDARVATYEENGVEHATWLAVADQSVCGYCAERSGKTYKLSEVVIPAHPNCRCFAAPYRPHWKELGLTDDDWLHDHHEESVARSKQNPTGSKPSPFERASGMTSAPTPVDAP